MDFLKETGDPRATADGEIFETYPRLEGLMGDFPKTDGAGPAGAGGE